MKNDYYNLFYATPFKILTRIKIGVVPLSIIFIEEIRVFDVSTFFPHDFK